MEQTETVAGAVHSAAPVGRWYNRVFARMQGSFTSLTDLFFHRAIGLLGLVGVVLGMFVLPPTGVTSVSTCSMLVTLGMPCPSCGLTRSVTCIYHGEFQAAWQYNPFGYGFALFFLLLAPLGLMPHRWREAVRLRARKHDVAITVFLLGFLAALLIFGIVRGALVSMQYPKYMWWRTNEPPPAMRDRLPE